MEVENPINSAIFLASCSAFFIIAFLLFQKKHYFEALVFTYFGFFATKYHHERCCEKKCFEAADFELTYDLGITIAIGIYLAIRYWNFRNALIYILLGAPWVLMYQLGGYPSFIGHSIWHIITPVLFYWLVTT